MNADLKYSSEKVNLKVYLKLNLKITLLDSHYGRIVSIQRHRPKRTKNLKENIFKFKILNRFKDFNFK